MPLLRHSLAMLGLSAGAPVMAQTTPGAGPGRVVAAAISADALRAHLEFLADDALEGRAPGTRGGELAQKYIASQFRRLGLEPAGDSGSYFQQVPIISLTPSPSLSVVAPVAMPLTWKDDFTLWSMRNDSSVGFRGEAVFVGYGIVAPELGWNDYAGLDPKGKIVVALVNDPGLQDSTLFRGKILTYYGRWTYKVEEAGLTKVRFSGEIRGKPLPPGSHRFSVVMEDSVGNTNGASAPSVEVTVKDPGKPVPVRKPSTRPKPGERPTARGGEPSLAPKNAPLTTVGIADQSPTMFAAPLFRSLGVKRSRYGPAWNSIFTEPEVVDTWMKAAQAANVEPLIAFNTARGSNCPTQPCKLPSVAEYRTAFRAFREKYPYVKNYQPWNEANHQSQPTARNPKAAAQYYNVVKDECRTCTVVALDLLDSSNMTRYLKSFLLYADGKPRLWGLHNYSDVNRFTSKGTKSLLRAAKGDIWITESGGLVSFETKSGRRTFPTSEKRAAKATEFMFKISRDYRHRIKRLYIYHWQGGTDNRFDAGIVRGNGSARPTYQVIRRHKAQIK